MASPNQSQPAATPRGQPTRRGLADAEDDLRRENPELIRLLDGAPDGILIHRGLRYVYANPAALKLLGRAREDVIGHSPFDLVPPRFRLLLAERVMEVFAKNRPMPEVEERLLHASGTEVPVEVIDVPITFGGSVAMLVHVRDITARRALEIRLRSADRLASASLIASGVVHEISHPLTAALASLGNVEKLAQRVEPVSAELLDALALVRSNISRAERVAREASIFADDSHLHPKHVDVCEILEAALAFLGPELRSRANVIERYSEVPKVVGSRARLAQVFLNLLTIAIQSLSHLARGANDVIVTVGARGSSSVLVTIQDTGIWRPHDLPCAMLEPLLNTKSSGTGLALALARELLAKEKGELTMKTELGTGTTFTVTLPAVQGDRLHAYDSARTRVTGKRILVVDDEPRIAAAVKMMLCEHKTTIARTGHEALQRLHSGETYDVIVCDLLVENIDGIDLYRRIREEWPGLHSRIIFLTGDAFISRTQEFLAEIPNRHLQKPFGHDELLTLVDEVLGA